MKLSHELGKLFEEEFDKIIQAEIDNPGFMAQEQFPNCESRAFAGIAAAMPKLVKTLALAICSHREVEHKEDHGAEIEHLSMNLSPKEVDIGIRSWWNN